MITIDEIKEAFEVAFDGDSSPLEHGFIWLDEPSEILKPNGDVIIGIYESHHATHLEFWGDGQMEKLVLNLPTLCKMLIDATAEIERLKSDNERVSYIVEFDDDWMWTQIDEFKTLKEANDFIEKNSVGVCRIVRQEII